MIESGRLQTWKTRVWFWGIDARQRQRNDNNTNSVRTVVRHARRRLAFACRRQSTTLVQVPHTHLYRGRQVLIGKLHGHADARRGIAVT
jgi:hypothetical protein